MKNHNKIIIYIYIYISIKSLWNKQEYSKILTRVAVNPNVGARFRVTTRVKVNYSQINEKCG